MMPAIKIIGAAINDDVMMYGADDDNAATIIAALDAAGYVVVPKEPTPKMEAAGAIANGECTAVGVGNIYRAMIGAVHF